MGIYDYQEAFGAWDRTTGAMRKAIREWFELYYQSEATADSDPCQRIPYTVVTKLVKTIFGEYKVSAKSPAVQQIADQLDRHRKAAIWARLHSMSGLKAVSEVPLVMPFSSAHSTALP